jgi:hypothetical protein
MITNKRRYEVVKTTTPLDANGVFTSEVLNSTGSARITGIVFSDQSSATDGVRIQQSIDGTNWDYESLFTLTGGTGLAFSVELVAAYARVRYVNGATAQTEFRLAAYFS